MESLLAGSISFTNHGRRETNDKIQIGLGQHLNVFANRVCFIFRNLSGFFHLQQQLRVGKSQWKRECHLLSSGVCVFRVGCRRYIKTGAKNQIKSKRGRLEIRRKLSEKRRRNSIAATSSVFSFLFCGVNKRSSAKSWWMTMTVCIFRVKAMTDSFSDVSSTRI